MSSYHLSLSEQEILSDRLNNLVRYLLENFVFYQDAFKSVEKITIDSLADMANFPTLDKLHPGVLTLVNQVLANTPPAYFETSGTSGNPFPVIPDLGSERSIEFANFIAEWLSLGDCKINRAVIALPFEMNPIGLKYLMALNRLNITAIPVGVKTHLCSPKKVLDVFQRLQPELLIARPLETLRYAEAMIAEGINPATSSIKKIIMTGEIVSQAKFERISRLYGGADVRCVYGLTEVDSGGLVSCSRYQYHLPSIPYLMVELLKNDFKTPVTEEGEVGHILLTNTHKNYMPLFRYKTGDFGKLQHNCGCEFKTPVINVMGRHSDCIEYQGCQIFPIEIENVLFRRDELASDYQIISDHGEIRLRLELMYALKPDAINLLTDQIRTDIYNELGIKIHDIDLLMPGELANKLGIAKNKAGTLYRLDGLSKHQKEACLKVNYDC